MLFLYVIDSERISKQNTALFPVIMVHSSFLKLLGTLSKKEILSFHAFSQGAHAQKKNM